ncbi:MAG TPA: hypothetical protein VMR52_06680 [Dehalococcoidia bacterium]|nr:hypothetical protein [Dehalococcoidia bacterium]
MLLSLTNDLRLDLVDFTLNEGIPHLAELLRFVDEEDYADSLDGAFLSKLLGDLGVSGEEAELYSESGESRRLKLDLDADDLGWEAERALRLSKASRRLEVKALIAEHEATETSKWTDSLFSSVLDSILDLVQPMSQLSAQIVKGDQTTIDDCVKSADLAVNAAGTHVGLKTIIEKGLPRSQSDRRLIPKFTATLAALENQVNWLHGRASQDQP